ncbi:PAS domain-containing protein [Rhizobium sp. RM]|uniref:PAS domain-containing protein n=1 Tax=Rhizobium sp. RM TaxID=2748079 RepID=UPI00110D8DEE|nr:PAS domain-containing protein [Rhizobium sp. RM]NWJ26389.1 PAS domain-containing protein [Rhizobium sp. RM]TMV18011.1 PAS domain-containing protein [Rhizobium sp. Td3]
MKHTAGLDIYAYWNELRGGRSAPKREDIDPVKLKHHLGDLFILSDAGQACPRFRLAGTRVCALFGRELRDSSFSDLWLAENAAFACRIAQGVMQHALPVLFTAEAEDEYAPSPLNFEMLLLPLRSDHSEAPRLLGALLPEKPRPEFASPIDSMALISSNLLRIETFGSEPLDRYRHP